MLIISILFIISIFSLYNICKIRKLYLSLQPQTRNNGAIAQLVEQRTENPCVPGSIPGGTTFLSNRNVAQLVAHYVRDVGVGRSSRLIPTEGDKRAKSVVAFSFPPSQLAVNLRKILKTSFSFSVR